ncbi:MAG TPA: hypothetical protein PKW21_02860 [Rhabdaerophilum sp.]|nr:hypothetical protein [Rhabdaerophilum sp.]
MSDFPLRAALTAEANKVHRAADGKTRLPYLRPRDDAARPGSPLRHALLRARATPRR